MALGLQHLRELDFSDAEDQGGCTNAVEYGYNMQ